METVVFAFLQLRIALALSKYLINFYFRVRCHYNLSGVQNKTENNLLISNLDGD